MKKKITLFITSIFLLVYVSTLKAQTHVSGLISGQTWTASGSPYIVDSNIFVASLTINASVHVLFHGNYLFEIGGILSAIGTPCDSIYFKPDTNATEWQGILFQNTVPGSTMSYCVVEQADSSGIRIIESRPAITHCSFRNNSTRSSGGGMKVFLTTSGVYQISDCSITNNITSTNYTMPASNGGGIYVSSSTGTVQFINCIVGNNQSRRTDGGAYGGGIIASGNVELLQCIVTGNLVYAHDLIPGGGSAASGGGLYFSGGLLKISNSILEYNFADGWANGGMAGNSGVAYGGAINLNSGQAIMKNSIISYNDIYGSHSVDSLEGSGLFVNTCQDSIENCTFAYNSKQVINNSGGTVNLINSIIYFNHFISANNYGTQLVGNFSASYSDIHNGYPGWGNINYNPVFQSTNCLTIVTGSPCIDAGDSSVVYNDSCLPPSLGNVRNDMGAHGGSLACDWLNAVSLPITITDTTITSCTFGNNNGSINITMSGCISPNNLNWSGPNGFNSTNQNISGLGQGWYVLSYGNSNCPTIDSFYVNCIVGINEIIHENEIRLAPNPFNQSTTITFQSKISKDNSFILYDIPGNEVRKILHKENTTSFILERGDLKAGIYFYQLKDLKTKEVMAAGKVVVE